MDRLFRREFGLTETDKIKERRKIGVLGIGRQAGATFIATSIARYLAESTSLKVAFAELGKYVPGDEMIHDSLGMTQRFAPRECISFYSRVIERHYIRNLMNTESGINWAIRVPGDKEGRQVLTELETSRLLNNLQGEMIICDLSHGPGPGLLSEMDCLVCVIDPMPSRLIAGKELLDQVRFLEKSGRHIVWVMNKNNPGVNKRLVSRKAGRRKKIVVPLMDPMWFYTAQYHCRIPYDQPEIKKQISKATEEICHHHILFTQP